MNRFKYGRRDMPVMGMRHGTRRVIPAWGER